MRDARSKIIGFLNFTSLILNLEFFKRRTYEDYKDYKRKP